MNTFQKLSIFKQTVEAVQYIHQSGYLHRDIKPENILLDKNLQVKLCDFGWSCVYNPKKERKSLCGTNEYMAPEIFQSLNQNKKIDVWSLGILLYELFHGRLPFENFEDHQIKNIPYDMKLDWNLIDLMKKCLHKDPSKRISTKKILLHPIFQPQIRKSLKNNKVKNSRERIHRINQKKKIERNIFGDITNKNEHS